jgi:hypothetical protein
VRAFFAPEKLRWRFIATSRLQKPPESGVMTALWAINCCSGHCLYFLFLIAQDLNFRRLFRNIGRGCYGSLSLFGKTALFTEQNWVRLLALELEPSTTFRAKLHFRLDHLIGRTLPFNKNLETRNDQRLNQVTEQLQI